MGKSLGYEELSLEFDESYSTDKLPCVVYFRGSLVFNIRYDKSSGKFWICDSGSVISFQYNGSTGLDFIGKYKYADSLVDAKINCEHIMRSYIDWVNGK